MEKINVYYRKEKVEYVKYLKAKFGSAQAAVEVIDELLKICPQGSTAYDLKETRKIAADDIIPTEQQGSMTIRDMLDIVHWAIIKKSEFKENTVILEELKAIDEKIETGKLENYIVDDTTLFKSMVAGSFQKIFGPIIKAVEEGPNDELPK